MTDRENGTPGPTKTTPLPSGASDLMSRLKAFLPRMEEANQALSTEQNLPRVDLALEAEPDSDEDDSNDDDDDESGDEAPGSPPPNAAGTASPGKPTIQIRFAVGDTRENPIIDLLANQQEQGPPPTGTDDDDDEAPAAEGGRKRAIAGLLSRDDDEGAGAKKKPNTGKPLITEL